MTAPYSLPAVQRAADLLVAVSLTEHAVALLAAETTDDAYAALAKAAEDAHDRLSAAVDRARLAFDRGEADLAMLEAANWKTIRDAIHDATNAVLEARTATLPRRKP